MGLWGAIFAAGYDRFMAPTERAGLSRLRAELVATAGGRVLEVGAGTGANLPFYGSAVKELLLTEPEAHMERRLKRRVRAHSVAARVLRARAEDLPLADGCVDVVVSTLALCTVGDPSRALAEARRVLVPNGRLLFLEHVRSDDARVAAWQRRLRRPWSWFGHGCQCDRATVSTIIEAGFRLEALRHETMPNAPALVRRVVMGSAVVMP